MTDDKVLGVGLPSAVATFFARYEFIAFRAFLINSGCALCLLGATTETGISQGTFMSYLVAQKAPEGSSVLLTVCGYPGSSNQVQYLEEFTASNQWNVVTNVTLTNGTLSFADLIPPHAATLL